MKKERNYISEEYSELNEKFFKEQQSRMNQVDLSRKLQDFKNYRLRVEQRKKNKKRIKNIYVNYEIPLREAI